MDADSQTIPYTHRLQDVFGDSVEEVRPRWKNLLETFRRRYGGHDPDLVARSPGRVNIIGEHIDYSLYSVLPMAIGVDVLVAIRVVPSSSSSSSSSSSASASVSYSSSPSSIHALPLDPEQQPSLVEISNVDPDRFPSAEIEVPAGGEVYIDSSKHVWTNYFLAGLDGCIELLRKENPAFSGPSSMQVLVDGNVPAGGGLSSSAAFVCASALAVMRSHDHQVTKKDLFELAIVSERLAGVNAGGRVDLMDQAASIFSLQGTALHTSFYPTIHTECVTFPKTEPDMVFVIAQSFVVSDKNVTGPVCYNLRVVECTLAAAILAKLWGLKVERDSSPLGHSLMGFHLAWQAKYEKEVKNGSSEEEILEKLIQVTEEKLDHVQGYTRDEMCEILKTTVPELEQEYMTTFPVRAERFQLRLRAQHVFSEALRVLKFKKLLTASDCARIDGSNHSNNDKIYELGKLMNESQTSCRDLYDCSCPELDELCEIAQKAGAAGSRLTGAGWGGCTVHLVAGDRVREVMAAWKEQYYSKKLPNRGAKKLKEAIVISKPSHGSYVISPHAD